MKNSISHAVDGRLSMQYPTPLYALGGIEQAKRKPFLTKRPFKTRIRLPLPVHGYSRKGRGNKQCNGWR